jgi:hypothetical protein
VPAVPAIPSVPRIAPSFASGVLAAAVASGRRDLSAGLREARRSARYAASEVRVLQESDLNFPFGYVHAGAHRAARDRSRSCEIPAGSLEMAIADVEQSLRNLAPLLDRLDDPRAVVNLEDLSSLHVSDVDLDDFDLSTLDPNDPAIDNLRFEEMELDGLDEEEARQVRSLLGYLDNNGVTPRYLAELSAAGLDDVSATDVVALRHAGVDPRDVRALRDAGFDDLDAEDLIELRHLGLGADYVDGLRWFGYEPDEETLVELGSHGIPLGFAAHMRRIGYRDLTLDQLIRLHSHGVTGEYAMGMMIAGCTASDPEDLVHLATHGVTTEYTAGHVAVFGRPLTPDELVELRRHGIDVEDAASLLNAGGPFDVEEVIELRIHGVTASFIQRAKDAGYRDAGVDELIELRHQGLKSGRRGS